MRLALFYPWLEGSGGDPAYCRLLCDALARRGVRSVILCREGPYKTKEPLVSARYPRWRAPLLLADLADLDEFLRRERLAVDALVVVGGFSPFNAGAALVARRHRVPYVVSTEGTVAPLVFTHGRRLLKRVYWRVVERWILSHAGAVRVLSDFEAGCLGALGIRTPMVLAAEGPEKDALDAHQSYDRLRTVARHFLFLGRLDIWQKALDNLVMGFAAALREQNLGQRLTLAGPPLAGAVDHLRRLFASEGLVEGRDVTLSPPVYGTAKWELLQSADVFLHPSRNEGIPRSVVEALAMGLPAIVSSETNLATAVERAAAGWRIDATPAGVTSGVLAAMAAGDLQARSANAARLARTELSWDAIAAAFATGLVDVLANGKRTA
jgi:glycosyltransferase involved in cell wall biosynthesis